MKKNEVFIDFFKSAYSSVGQINLLIAYNEIKFDQLISKQYKNIICIFAVQGITNIECIGLFTSGYLFPCLSNFILKQIYDYFIFASFERLKAKRLHIDQINLILLKSTFKITIISGNCISVNYWSSLTLVQETECKKLG